VLCLVVPLSHVRRLLVLAPAHRQAVFVLLLQIVANQEQVVVTLPVLHLVIVVHPIPAAMDVMPAIVVRIRWATGTTVLTTSNVDRGCLALVDNNRTVAFKATVAVRVDNAS